MASKGTLTVRVVGDTKPLERSLDGVGGKLKGFAGKAAVVGGAFAAIGGAAIVGGMKVVEWGATLEAQMKKAGVVFEDQLSRVQAWAKGNAKAMGLTSNELIGLSANFADLLKPMGFTAAQAADMSMEVNGLAGALAEWSGGQRTAAEVSQILAKAMLGERESLKELGISITEADVQQRLLEQGQKDLTGAALQQAKAIATQELIFEKSKDAQTAYAEGSGSLMRKQAELKATFGELRDELVTKLLPIAQKIVTWAADNLPGAIEKAQGFIEEWGPRFITVFKTVASVVGPIISGLIGLVGGLIDALMEAVSWLRNAVQWARNVADAIPGVSVGNVPDMPSRGSGKTPKGNQLGSVAGPVSSVGSGTGSGLQEFADGGVVGGPRGAKQLAYVHGGETVLPTHKGGFQMGGNVTVNVAGSVISERDLEEVVAKALVGRGRRNLSIAGAI